MADLISHLLVNQLLGQRCLDRRTLAWFVSGAVAPDLASRLPRMMIQQAMERAWLGPTEAVRAALFGLDVPHTPAGLALLCVAVAALSPAAWLPAAGRRAAGGWLLAGGISHLLFDLLQRHILPGYAYLWPLHDGRWELGWISTEATLAAIPVLAAAVWLTRPKGVRAASPKGDRPNDS